MDPHEGQRHGRRREVHWQGRQLHGACVGHLPHRRARRSGVRFAESRRIEKDVNRDGNPTGSSRLFAVLWNESTNDVWVDTDQDLDFSDEKAYTDYAVRPEFGVIGKDKPETPVRESVAFAVQTDRARQLVALNLGVASHASLVVGAAVASRGTQGASTASRPGHSS